MFIFPFWVGNKSSTIHIETLTWCFVRYKRYQEDIYRQTVHLIKQVIRRNCFLKHQERELKLKVLIILVRIFNSLTNVDMLTVRITLQISLGIIFLISFINQGSNPKKKLTILFESSNVVMFK